MGSVDKGIDGAKFVHVICGMRGAMPTFLKHATEDAERYLEREQDAWAELKREHDQAMFARDVEDLVDYGIYVLSSWTRRAQNWHRWVSEDPARYDAKKHKKLRKIEGMAAQAAEGTVGLINEVKTWGHEVQRESEFRPIAEFVIGAAVPANEQFTSKTFAKYQEGAWEEYQAGEAEEVTNWGD